MKEGLKQLCDGITGRYKMIAQYIWQKAEGRRQKAEGRRQKAEGRR